MAYETSLGLMTYFNATSPSPVVYNRCMVPDVQIQVILRSSDCTSIVLDPDTVEGNVSRYSPITKQDMA